MDAEILASELALRGKLALCDTGHDFKEERSTNSDENNPDALGSNAEAHVITKTKMINEFCNFLVLPKDRCELSNSLGMLTDNNVTSFSGRAGMTFEQSVQSYFEFKTKYKDLLGSNNIQRISYQEILDGYPGPDKRPGRLADKINLLIGNATTPHTQKILEVYFDENYDSGTRLTDDNAFTNPETGDIILSNVPFGIGAQLGYVQNNFNSIGNFILKYMFPNKNIGVDETHMTFDAAPKYVNKLFLKFEQVKNLLIPQNFADSASSSSNQLSGRSVPIFPVNIKNEAEEDIWNFNSNIFSQNIPNISVNIYIEKINPDQYYTINNVLEFKLCFEIIPVGQKPLIVEKRFSSKQKQGASVNYLSNLIRIAVINSIQGNPYTQYSRATSPTVSTIINIGEQLDQIAIYLGAPLPVGVDPVGVRRIGVPLERQAISSVIIKILFDLKRSGDWEQANAAENYRTRHPMTVYVSLDRLSALYSRTLQNPTIWHNNTNLYLYRYPTEEITNKLKLLYNIKILLIQGKKIREIYSFYDNINGLLSNIYRVIDENKNNAFTNISRAAKSKTNTYSSFIGLISTILLRLKLNYTQHKIDEVLEVLKNIIGIINKPAYIENSFVVKEEMNYNELIAYINTIINEPNEENKARFIYSVFSNSENPKYIIFQRILEIQNFQELPLRLEDVPIDIEEFSSIINNNLTNTPLSILINSDLEEIGNETISEAISLLNIEEKSWKEYEDLNTFITKLTNELLNEENPLFYIGGRVKNVKIPLLELDTTLFDANKKMGFQESLNRSALMLESALRKITSGRQPRSNEVSVYKQLLENRDYGHVVEQMFPLIHPSMVEGNLDRTDVLNNSIKNFLLFSEGFTPELFITNDNIRFADLLGKNDDNNSITFITAYSKFRELLGIKEFFDESGYPINLPESYKKIILKRIPPKRGGGANKDIITRAEKAAEKRRNSLKQRRKSMRNAALDFRRGITPNPPLEQILDLYDLLENIGGIASTFVMNDLNELKDEIKITRPDIIFEYPWLFAFRLINLFIPCSDSIYYCKHQKPDVRLRSFQENIITLETTVEQIKNIYSSQLSSFTTYKKSYEPDAVLNLENQLYGDSFNYYANDAYTYIPTNSSFFLTLLLSLYFDGEKYVIDNEYIYGIYGNYFLQKNINYLLAFESYYQISEKLGLNNTPVDTIFEIITNLNTLKEQYIDKNVTISLGDGKVNHAKLLLNYYILLVFTLVTNRSLRVVPKQLDNIPDWKSDIVRIILTINSLIHSNIKINIPKVDDLLNIEPFKQKIEIRELLRGGKKKKTRRKNLKKRKKTKKIRVKKIKKTKKRVTKKNKKTRRNKK